MFDQLLSPEQFEDWYAETGRPFVTLSWAQSLDGSITLKQGSSSPVSCSKSMEMTHQLRSMHDGILVGIGTAIADNPRLTARCPNGQNLPQPRPIVLDSRLQVSEDMKLFAHPKRPIIATTVQGPDVYKKPFLTHQADVMTLPATAEKRVDLLALLDSLGKRGVKSVMIEGGGQVITSFLNLNLANAAIITIAPVFAGGYSVTQNVIHPHWNKLPRLKDINMVPCCSDMIVKGTFATVNQLLSIPL